MAGQVSCRFSPAALIVLFTPAVPTIINPTQKEALANAA
jgi:hypothetical protein